MFQYAAVHCEVSGQLRVYLLHLPNQYVFQWEENVSHAMGQNSLTTEGNNNLNIQLACDLKEVCVPADIKYLIFSQFHFELGGITKHLLTALGVPLGFASVSTEGLGLLRATESYSA